MRGASSRQEKEQHVPFAVDDLLPAQVRSEEEADAAADA
jgi:hypothetical protein